MNSINFPRMFNYTNTNIVSEKDAIREDMILLLSTERRTLFGDPYYGCELRKYIFEQSNSIIADLLIDELYTTIITFMPQVYLTRKDIKILTSRSNLYAEIKYSYVLDNTSDLFTIKLTDATEED